MDKNLSVLFYMSIMIFTGIFLYFGKNFEEKLKKKIAFIFYLIGFMPLFLMFALRYDVGTDYFYTYAPGFQTIVLGGERFEHGFYLINKFISFFTTNAQWLFVVTGFIYTYFVVDAIRRYSKNPLISLLVLFLMVFVFIAMNNVRQQIAVVIILWGFRFILNKKLLFYILTCLGAAYFFHKSAIFLIPMYFIINFKWAQERIYLLVLGGIISLPIISIAIAYFLNLLGYDYFFEYFGGGSGNKLLLIQNISITLVLFVAFDDKLKTDRFRYGLFVFQFVGLLVSLTSYTLGLIELPERISTFFMIFEVISIPLAIYDLAKGNKLTMITSYVLLFSILSYSFYDSIYLKGYHEVLPYKFIFGHYEELEAIKDIILLR